MSFIVKIGHNYSETNKLNKVTDFPYTYAGTLKNNTSIINPVIIFEGNIQQIADCNYMEIPVFSRFYYITNTEILRNNIFQISGRCDVLMTYKTEILKQKAIIKRQAINGNLYLNDGYFKTYQYTEIFTKYFPYGLTQESIMLAVQSDSQNITP